MVHLFRRFQQPLMILITVIVIISFVALYNTSRFMDRQGGDRLGSIYGTPVTIAQAQKVIRKFDVAQDLRLVDLLRALAIRQENAKENFLWNTFVLKHESEQLGIDPTDSEVGDAIQAMPVFQTRGVYDSNIYNNFVLDALSKRGMSGVDLEDIVRDDLRVKKIRALLESTAPPSASELRTAFEGMYQKLDASVIYLKIEDFLASVKVSDEDLKKLYEERKIGLKTDETRRVKYVAFILPTTDKPLEGPARAEALQKLEKGAEDFTIAMTEKDAKFDDVAAKAEVKVQETPAYAQAKPPAEFEKEPDVAAVAFKLSKNQPNSDALSTDRGYYVVQLEEITPGRPLTLEEAKDRLTEELKHERAQEAMNLKAAEIRNKIVADVKAGKTFDEAAQAAAGVKPEPFPAFSAEDTAMGRFGDKPDGTAIMQAANNLNAGETSMLIPTEKGGVIIHLDKREPIDEAKFNAEKPRVVEGVSDIRATVLFQEWLKLRRAAANVQGSSHS
jgi:parvulin-like peptidyl-prolyl isomerase